jgi:hypothetical protein
MPEVRIRFVREYEVKDGLGTRYKTGQILDVNEASALHFINRGVAARVTAATPAPASPESAAPDKPEVSRETRKGKK